MTATIRSKPFKRGKIQLRKYGYRYLVLFWFRGVITTNYKSSYCECINCSAVFAHIGVSAS